VTPVKKCMKKSCNIKLTHKNVKTIFLKPDCSLRAFHSFNAIYSKQSGMMSKDDFSHQSSCYIVLILELVEYKVLV